MQETSGSGRQEIRLAGVLGLRESLCSKDGRGSGCLEGRGNGDGIVGVISKGLHKRLVSTNLLDIERVAIFSTLRTYHAPALQSRDHRLVPLGRQQSGDVRKVNQISDYVILGSTDG